MVKNMKVDAKIKILRYLLENKIFEPDKKEVEEDDFKAVVYGEKWKNKRYYKGTNIIETVWNSLLELSKVGAIELKETGLHQHPYDIYIEHQPTAKNTLNLLERLDKGTLKLRKFEIKALKYLEEHGGEYGGTEIYTLKEACGSSEHADPQRIFGGLQKLGFIERFKNEYEKVEMFRINNLALEYLKELEKKLL